MAYLAKSVDGVVPLVVRLLTDIPSHALQCQHPYAFIAITHSCEQMLLFGSYHCALEAALPVFGSST